jgi:hypothetical protein
MDDVLNDNEARDAEATTNAHEDGLALLGCRRAMKVLKNATVGIDEQFGAGYAAAHPELLAAYMAAAMAAAGSHNIASALEDGLWEISNAIEVGFNQLTGDPDKDEQAGSLP